MTTATSRVRFRARVEGTVQGVGFRPYAYRLAHELGCAGHVLNDAHGVVVEVEGPPADVERFLARLPAEAPPLAAVRRVTRRELRPTGESGFAIVASPGGGEPDAAVTADSATCAECLEELFDPADRRFRYPFVNCTNCGPRFTIVRGVPYDRPRTTMAGFRMCPACQEEYDDPLDRRFHAQPNACPACGPSVRLVGVKDRGADRVASAAAALRAGAIIAVKGLGGYHLAVRADDEDAVARLRARKHREDKPFALMAPTVSAARELVDLGVAEEALLVARERPIVLAPRRARARVAAAVAPRRTELGVMLPYSPLHHLLLADLGLPVVLTSGNVSDEPIAFEDDDALERLRPIADGFLVHDRPIETRTDDSVVRAVGGRPLMLRRSRGYVPASIPLPVAARRPVLAVGAELKNTFCVAKGERAWVGHHIGDLQNYETLRSFAEGIAHFERLFAVAPAVVAHDLHPEYLSTKAALDHAKVELVGVQHHHAHLAACLAEHGETGPAVGAIYDGTGDGGDGTVWGGEVLVGDLEGFTRAGSLLPVRLPGSEAAIRQPWRMACAWLQAAGVPAPPALAQRPGWEQVAQLAGTGLASPVTSSVGRLFDAVAALCGIRLEVTYEGQAAIELEAACAEGDHGAYPFDAGLDPRLMIGAIVDDLGRGVNVAVIAARFHDTLATATADACARVAAERALVTVVLSGGVFANRRLHSRTRALLEERGLRVLVPERLPPGDGGISYGQAAVAAARP
jgi:hydrogenase maturation protein HypF